MEAPVLVARAIVGMLDELRKNAPRTSSAVAMTA
jgi:hypothetical protein